MRTSTRFRYSRLLLPLMFLVLLKQCRTITMYTHDRCIDGDDIRTLCPNDYHTIETESGCKRRFCLLHSGDFCSPYREEDKCAEGLVCICGRCSNCYGAVCTLHLCAQYEKRFKNILMPWYRPKWQEWLQTQALQTL